MEGSLVAYKVFTNGSTLQASEVNDNLMRQSVMVFSNAAARTAAITSPSEGMVTYLEDTDLISVYESGAWRSSLSPRGGVLQVVTGFTATEVSTTSTSFSDTGLSATITPKSATSKILVLVSQNGLLKTPGNADTGVYLRLVYPNSTDTVFGTGLGFTLSSSWNHTSASVNAEYAVTTTSPATFKTQFASRISGGSVAVQGVQAASTITLMEIAN
jgi:hypothetical protein